METIEYRVSRKNASNEERGPVSHVFIRFDSMEAAVSLARAVLLACRDGSLCVMVGKEMGSGDYNCRPETTPKGMGKIG